MLWLSRIVICLLFANNHCYALETPLEESIENLIQQQIKNPKFIIKLQYNNKLQLERARNKQAEIYGLSLLDWATKDKTFKIEVVYNDFTKEDITGRCIVFIEIPVAARMIKVGEIIDYNDLDTVSTKLVNRIAHYVTDIDVLVGMKAKKNLIAGAMIKSNDIVKPPILELHDTVNILYSFNNIEIKVSGVSMGSGAVGDKVKVKNIDTGAILVGNIINKNTVQVSYD